MTVQSSFAHTSKVNHRVNLMVEIRVSAMNCYGYTEFISIYKRAPVGLVKSSTSK